MSKEEAEAIAGALALARTTNPNSKGHQIAISDAALLIGSALKEIDSAFNRERFVEICGNDSRSADAQAEAAEIIEAIINDEPVFLVVTEPSSNH